MLQVYINEKNIKNLVSKLQQKKYYNFSIGDILYIRYFIIERKKNKYFLRTKEFFGRCIKFTGGLFRKTALLRKSVKLNEVEQIFLLDSPFILTLKVQKSFLNMRKNMLFLRKASAKHSRVKLQDGYRIIK